MAREALEILERHVNQLISVNSFFSSSRNRAAALFGLGRTASTIESERILFDIEADPSKVNSKPSSEISALSDSSLEAEVLFILGAIFRVNSILQPAEERVWMIRLEFCTNGETTLYTLGKYFGPCNNPNWIDFTTIVFGAHFHLMIFDAEKCKTTWVQGRHRKVDTRIPSPATWMTDEVTTAGGRGSGNALDQLFQPEGLAVDDDGMVFVVDSDNHQIVAWEQGNRTAGRLVAGGNGKGNRMDQLASPMDVVLDTIDEWSSGLDNRALRVEKGGSILLIVVELRSMPTAASTFTIWEIIKYNFLQGGNEESLRFLSRIEMFSFLRSKSSPSPSSSNGHQAKIAILILGMIVNFTLG